MIGYASDGESLMQGTVHSVMTEIKKEVPDIYILKCYCQSFHLIAEHACKTQSKTAESLVHDVYNYFKTSPNRQNSFSEFQVFTQTEPHKLCPSQTRWLSLQQCVSRILEQWTALELFFQAEFSEAKNLQSEKILQNLRSPYVKATLEFMDFVLGDI